MSSGKPVIADSISQVQSIKPKTNKKSKLKGWSTHEINDENLDEILPIKNIWLMQYIRSASMLFQWN